MSHLNQFPPGFRLKGALGQLMPQSLAGALLVEVRLTDLDLTDEYTSCMANEIQAAIKLLEAERDRIDTARQIS